MKDDSCEYDKHIEAGDGDDVLRRDEEDAAEQIAHGVAAGRGFIQQYDTHRHAHHPDGADDGIFALFCIEAHQSDDQRRANRGGHRAVHGVEGLPAGNVAEIQPGADAAQCGMGDGSGQIRQPPGHDIGTDDAHGDARQEAGHKRVAHEGDVWVAEEIEEISHRRPPFSALFPGKAYVRCNNWLRPDLRSAVGRSAVGRSAAPCGRRLGRGRGWRGRRVP